MRLNILIARFSQALIKGYAFLISPLLGRTCRFEPTCSRYAHEAIERHGPWAGIGLTISRLMRCHPWSKADWHDPVPERFTATRILRYKRRDPRACGGHCAQENCETKNTAQKSVRTGRAHE